MNSTRFSRKRRSENYLLLRRAITQEKRPNPPGVYLTSLTVEGFRGIGQPVTLKFAPGPGLTLVVGRNGSGKSSLAEGLECC